MPSTSSFLNLLLAYWCWHVDMSYYSQKSTIDVLVLLPTLSAELIVRLAKRLETSHPSSPFSQKVETHFEPDSPCQNIEPPENTTKSASPKKESD
jgi:hypothetical protein